VASQSLTAAATDHQHRCTFCLFPATRGLRRSAFFAEVSRGTQPADPRIPRRTTLLARNPSVKAMTYLADGMLLSLSEKANAKCRIWLLHLSHIATQPRPLFPFSTSTIHCENAPVPHPCPTEDQIIHHHSLLVMQGPVRRKNLRHNVKLFHREI